MTYSNKIGLGMMRFEPDLNTIKQFLNEAFKLGITYVESCSFYIQGQCETLLGQALKDYPRESYELGAKFCYHDNVEGYDFEHFFNEQLNKLQVDYIDYYLFQAVDRTSFKEDGTLKDKVIEYYNILVQKQKEGKVKYIGFSFHDTPPYLEHLLSTYKWDVCQLQLNYYDWYLGVAKDLYSLTEKYEVPVFVMGGLKGGTLGDKNSIPPHLAYKFLNMLPNVKLVLNGSTSIQQLKENQQLLNSGDILTKAEVELIKNIAYADTTIKCTGCKYCNGVCPQGFKLYDIFATYNQAILNKNGIEYLNALKSGGDQTLHCIGCGRCEYSCPQHLPIRRLMQERIFQLRL